MESLLEYIKDFKNTEPIFHIKLSSDSEDVSLVPLSEYKPTPKQDDQISELVCESFCESFKVNKYKEGYVSNIDAIISKSVKQIRGSVHKFLDKNLPMRNPRQSKLYRWAYREMPTEANESLLHFYKYIEPHCDGSFKIKDSADKGHVSNAIAIIELIRGKYEK